MTEISTRGAVCRPGWRGELVGLEQGEQRLLLAPIRSNMMLPHGLRAREHVVQGYGGHHHDRAEQGGCLECQRSY